MHKSFPALAGLEEKFRSVRTLRLGNGFTLLLAPDPTLPLVSFQLAVRAGSIYEGEHLGSGLSHFLEHALFLGSRKRPASGGFSREAEECGGIDNNAFTGYDHTAFVFTLRADALAKGFDLLCDLATAPLLQPKRIEVERDVILAEMTMDRDDPESRVGNDFSRRAFPTHPLGLPILGEENRFKRIKASDLRAYHAAHYLPSRMVLALAGDFDPARAEELCASTFGLLPPAPEMPITPLPELCDPGPAEGFLKADLERPRLKLGFAVPCFRDPEATALDLLETMLSTGRDSRFERKLVATGKILGAEAACWTPDPRGLFSISALLASAEASEVSRVRDLLFAEVRAASESPSRSEILSAKRKILADALSSVSTLGGLAYTLAQSWISTGRCDDLLLETRELLAVDADRVKSASRRHLGEEKVFQVVYAKDEPKGRTAATRRVAGEWKRLGAAGGGVTLLHRQGLPGELAHVVIALRGGQEFEEPGRQGLFHLLQTTMLDGARWLSGDRIARAVESEGGSASAWSGISSFGVSASFLPGTSDRLRKVLRGVLRHADFPKAAFETRKSQCLAALAMGKEDLGDFAQRETLRRFYGDHVFGVPVQGTEASVSSLRREDLLLALDRHRSSGRIVVAVTGDLGEDEALLWGELIRSKSEERDAPAGFVPFDFEDHDWHRTVVPGKEQTLYSMLWRIPDLGHSDHRWFEFLSAVWGGAGGPLFALREKHGFAYSIGFGHQPRRSGSMAGFSVSIGSHVGSKARWVRENFEALVERTAKGLSASEIRRGLASFQGGRALSRQNRMAEAQVLALYELYGLGFESQLAEENLGSEDPARLASECARLVRQWLPAGKALRLAIGSKP